MDWTIETVVLILFPLFLSLELFLWLLTLLGVNVLPQSLTEDVLLLKLPGEVCVLCLHFLVAQNM